MAQFAVGGRPCETSTFPEAASGCRSGAGEADGRAGTRQTLELWIKPSAGIIKASRRTAERGLGVEEILKVSKQVRRKLNARGNRAATASSLTASHTFAAMNARLTLLLKKSLVERAKEEASERGTTLSKLVERLLESSIAGIGRKRKKPSNRLHPAVESLVGVIKLPKDFDYDQAREEYLREKFGQ